jgi:CheY-like chemotaxis protein
LATVYGIVQQSGGVIQVTSEVGKGSKFAVYLPAIAESRHAVSESEKPAPASAGRETVLLVEDEETVRKLTSTILRQHGYTVLEAAHGVEALRILGQTTEPVSLLVADLVMPTMSGQALADLVAHERPDIKVLFLSGYADALMSITGADQPRRNVLAKPFTPDGLAGKVRELLDGKPSPADMK